MNTIPIKKYDFELTDFALSDDGIHFLRSGFNYKTILYLDLHTAIIVKGAESKNFLLSLLLGIGLLIFSVSKCISLYHDFNNPTVYTVYIESLLLPLFPALVGIYLTYISLKRGPLLLIEQGNVRHKLRLRELQKRNEGHQFILYLSSKLSSKLIVEHNL